MLKYRMLELCFRPKKTLDQSNSVFNSANNLFLHCLIPYCTTLKLFNYSFRIIFITKMHSMKGDKQCINSEAEGANNFLGPEQTRFIGVPSSILRILPNVQV